MGLTVVPGKVIGMLAGAAGVLRRLAVMGLRMNHPYMTVVTVVQVAQVQLLPQPKLRQTVLAKYPGHQYIILVAREVEEILPEGGGLVVVGMVLRRAPAVTMAWQTLAAAVVGLETVQQPREMVVAE
jgi:hypothetical protein